MDNAFFNDTRPAACVANHQNESAPEAAAAANTFSEKDNAASRHVSASGFSRRRMGTDNPASKSLKIRPSSLSRRASETAEYQASTCARPANMGATCASNTAVLSAVCRTAT